MVVAEIFALSFDTNDKINTTHRAEIIELFGSDKKQKKVVKRECVAHAAEPVRSLDDIRAIQNYFLNKNQIRNYAIFTVGICSGLRVSDLFSLKVHHVLNEDGTFKECINIVEKKTGKASSNIDDSCLITEAMRIAITKYFAERGKYSLDEPLFRSRKGGKMGDGSLDPRTGWRILKEAQMALNLPYNVGSHTMRKSFVNIAACIGGKSNIDMSKLLSIQHMLKHSDYRTTMRYLRLSALFTEKARVNVSDFVLGKTDKNDLTEALFENPENEKMCKILESIYSLFENDGTEV